MLVFWQTCVVTVYMFGRLLTPTDAIELRVLSGTRAGASLNLTREPVLVGTADTADVVLDGPDLAEHHARVVLESGNRFSVVPVNGRTLTQGGDSELTKLALGTVVYLGSIAVTVEHQSAPWSKGSEVPPAARVTESENRLSSTRWLRWIPRPIVLVGIVVTVAIATAGLALQPNAATTVENASTVALDAARETVRRQGLGAHTRLTWKDGSVVVEGYVPTRRQLNGLLHALGTQGVRVQNKLMAINELSNAAQISAAKLSKHLRVGVAPDGTATLSGLAESQEQMNEWARSIQSSSTGLTEIRKSPATEQLLDEWVTSWNRMKYSDGKPRASLSQSRAGGWLLDGEFSADERADLVNFLYTRANAVRVVALLRTSDNKSASAPSRAPAVRATSRGRVPYVVLQSGDRILIGGSVDGYTLKSIGETGPVFSSYQSPTEH